MKKDRSHKKGGNEPMMPLGLLSMGEKAEVLEVRHATGKMVQVVAELE